MRLLTFNASTNIKRFLGKASFRYHIHIYTDVHDQSIDKFWVLECCQYCIFSREHACRYYFWLILKISPFLVTMLFPSAVLYVVFVKKFYLRIVASSLLILNEFEHNWNKIWRRAFVLLPVRKCPLKVSNKEIWIIPFSLS